MRIAAFNVENLFDRPKAFNDEESQRAAPWMSLLDDEAKVVTSRLGKDRFRVTTEDQLIVSDGETLWTYSQPSHRVLIDDLSTTENTLLPRQILFQYTEDYQVSVIREENFVDKACYVLGFTPETGDVFFTEIMAWVASSSCGAM